MDRAIAGRLAHRHGKAGEQQAGQAGGEATGILEKKEAAGTIHGRAKNRRVLWTDGPT